MSDTPASPGTARLLKGAPIAAEVRQTIEAAVGRYRAGGVVPTLAVVIASDDPAVRSYAAAKERAAARLGIQLRLDELAAREDQHDLEARLDRLSGEAGVHGILLELPLAPRFDPSRAIDRIAPAKDVDGLTAINLGLIAGGREAEALAPATPLACIRLAEEAIALAGARAVVIGRGRTVGRALAPMLVNRDATVTVCHTRTRDLAAAVAGADIVFVAAGRRHLLTPALVRPGQVVVDAGINPTADGIAGDADPAVAGIVAALTPVPGGVGPLTSTLVFANLLRAMRLQGLSGDAR